MDTSQKIGIWSGFALRKEGRGLSQRGARLGLLVLAGLGMMIFLLSGCGSDSTPKDAASGKKATAAKSGFAMQQSVTPLLPPKDGGTAPPYQHFDKFPGLGTAEEIEAKREAAARAWEKLDPKEIVFSGLTKEQLEASLEAERAKKPDPNREIFAGLTLKQLEANLEVERAKKPDRNREIFAGFTEEQMKAKAAQARQMQETKSTRPEHVFPPR